MVTARRAAAWVAGLNLSYFVVEITIALAIESVSLFADSVDFLEDTSVNTLVFFALEWRAERRVHVARLLAVLLLVPSLATALMACRKFATQTAPAPLPLSVTGLGALIVNLFCALLLARVRHQGGSLMRAAFLSARNDAFANVAIVAAAGLTVWQPTPWPDLLVGIGIFFLNLDAAREVIAAAQRERSDAPPS
jgi:Co/Zn/Cd efflux system component